MGAPRRQKRARTAEARVFFQNQHEAMAWAVLAAGLVDSETDVKDIREVEDVADEMFLAWLDRVDFENPPEPEVLDPDEREDD